MQITAARCQSSKGQDGAVSSTDQLLHQAKAVQISRLFAIFAVKFPTAEHRRGPSIQRASFAIPTRRLTR